MEQTLTHSEWHVMDCLWQHSPSTVMELVTALHQKVGWARAPPSPPCGAWRQGSGDGGGTWPHQVLHPRSGAG